MGQGEGGHPRDLTAVGWVWVLLIVLPKKDISAGVSQWTLTEGVHTPGLWPRGALPPSSRRQGCTPWHGGALGDLPGGCETGSAHQPAATAPLPEPSHAPSAKSLS